MSSSRQDLQHSNNRTWRRRRHLLGGNLQVLSWIVVIAFATFLNNLYDNGMKAGGILPVVDAAVVSKPGKLTAFGPGSSTALYSCQIVYFDEDHDSVRLPAYHRIRTNLMLPPGIYHSELCEYPSDAVEEYASSMKQQQQSEITLGGDSEGDNSNTDGTGTDDSSTNGDGDDDLLPVTFEYSPLALLVRLGGCDVMQKVRVALQIQQNVTADLLSIVFYNNNDTASLEGDEIANLTIPNDMNSTTVPGIDSLILAAISYSSGYTILDQMDRIISLASHVGDVVSPIMLTGVGNDQWRFPLGLETSTSSDTGSDGDGNYDEFGTKFFTWIRFILIALFICLPIFRGISQWYGAGGRILFARNENGWIVGLTYVRASIPFRDNHGDTTGPNSRSRVHGKLTEEQVMELLPEISYVVPPVDHDIVIEGEDFGGLQSSSITAMTTTITTPASAENSRNDEPTIQIGMGTDDAESLAGRCEQQSAAATRPVTSQEEGSSRTATNTTAQGTIGVNNDSEGETDTDHNMEAGDADGDAGSSSVTTGRLYTATISTTCSICIEEFIEGETIRLLPKCGHAYHTECILPWLTERQGCCPFCKAEVLGTTHNHTSNVTATTTTTANSNNNAAAAGGGEDQ